MTHRETIVASENRVDPWGRVFATAERGYFMGNRSDSKAWITCGLRDPDGAAFFSAQDDEDDTERGGLYLARVLGEVTAARVSVAARLVVHGHFATLSTAIELR